MVTRLITNGLLIDGTGREPIPDAYVLIEGDRIAAVGPGAQARALEAGEVEIIDARSGAILPGFIDCHAHMTFEVESVEAQLRRPLSLNFYNSVRYMRATLDAGITTVRDAGGADLGTKLAVETGVVPGPRLQITISPLTPTGGHFDQRFPIGVSPKVPPYPGRPDPVCDGVEEVRKRVREVLLAGADLVKICTTGGVLSPSDRPEYTQFSPEEIAVCVQEAAYRGGRKVMAHAIGTEGIKNAVRAGVHSIEHGHLLDDECVELMVKRGTYLVPTMMAGLSIIELCERKGLGLAILDKAKQINERHQGALERAHRAGIPIAFGTDASVFPHGENLRELVLMTGFGMSPMETIVSATHVAAKCLGWDDRIGTIQPGKLADIVISRVDPLRDLAGLHDRTNIALVMKGGEIVKDLLRSPRC